jgi:hypothetical protein
MSGGTGTTGLPTTVPNACQCIELMNEALAEDGSSAMVDTAWIWSQNTDTHTTRIAIRCVKTSRSDRKRAPVLIAQFCPLCGTPYGQLSDWKCLV